MPRVRFYDDPAAFLAIAGEHLAADPVLANVLAGYADRDASEGVPEAPFHWYATLLEGGRVVGAAMRTAPFAPYPPYLVAMPDDAAVLLARTLHERGEHPGGANGVLPATRIFAEEMLLKIDGGRVLLWEVAGEPVSLAGIAPPVFGVGRIAPVYTPPEHRGHGYASAGVAEGSRRLHELGRVCLTTDVANPVSNRIYAALGYQPLADLGQLTLEGAP